MARAVGIDLGTTDSVVCVLQAGEPTVIPNAEGSRTTPSVVAFAKDGEVLVGEAARRQAVTNASRTICSVKRRMGTDWSIPIGEKTFSAQEISAFVLRKLKRDAEAYLGEKVTAAVITVPAYFSQAQRQATREAGELAGLDVLRVISEPSAAGLGHALGKSGKTALVVRLGGGTFDVSLVDVAEEAHVEHVVQVKATSGDDRLGGDDWDQAVADYLVTRFENLHGVDLSSDRTAVQRLREAAETAKIELSSSSQTTIELPYLAASAEGPLHLNECVTRARFQELTRGLLERCKAPVQRVLKDAAVPVRNIDQVVLVGGGSRMPAVADLMCELTGGKTPSRAAHGDEVVAIGAALQAGVLTGVRKDVLLLDAVPMPLGVETAGGVMTVVVERSTTIPTRCSEIFTTAEDMPGGDARPIVFHVHQGDHPAAAHNHRLGTLALTGLPPARRGVPRIELTLEIDANGTVSALAKDLDSERVWPMVGVGGTEPYKEGIAVVTVVKPEAEQPESASGEPPSEQVSAAVERERLGGHQTTYHAKPRGLMVPAVLATAFLVLTGIGITIPNMYQVAVCGLLTAVFGALLLGARYANRRYAQLQIFDQGLVVVDADGRPTACRWDALSVRQKVVDHYHYGVPQGRSHAYTLKGPDGETLLHPGGIPYPEHWGPAIQDAVTEAQLPIALAAVRRGETVSFGDISVNRDAVTAYGRSVTWDRIRQISVEAGTVSLNVAGKWLPLTSTKVSSIPNFFVFHALAEHLRRSA
ncbi:DUF6585 family protein [Streptomyces flavidovirens]